MRCASRSSRGRCFKTQKNSFLKQVSKTEMARTSLAAEYQIGQIAFVPFEDGVMEFGTSLGTETATWPDSFEQVPKAPKLPADELRQAY